MTLLKGLALLAPKLPLKPLFDEHLIVSDENALQNWRDDPLSSKDKLRLGYIVIFFDCLDNLTQDIAQQIDLPMLMMCGNADRVVTMSGHQLMLDKNRHNDKQLKVYANGLHNLLQEPNLKLQVMSDIQEWILERSFENEQL
jgi:alpha-beta hydrolase superfamily lysophospholipase